MALLLEKPWLGIGLAFLLAFLDYPLTAISRDLYYRYMFRYVDYEAMGKSIRGITGAWGALSKMLMMALLAAVWAIFYYGQSPTAGPLFLWLLGFVIGTYFIADLRHLESILLARLYGSDDQVSGKIIYHSTFSLKISAIHFFSIFLIFALILFYRPDYFMLGLSCAPLFLTLRNLLLS